MPKSQAGKYWPKPGVRNRTSCKNKTKHKKQGHLVNHLQFIKGEAGARGARLEAGLPKAPSSTLHLT